MGRCKPTKSNPSGRCGMSMGIYNPFFQNGNTFYGSSASVLPTQLSGLQYWYDISQLTTLSDGNTVQTITDLSGNGHHLIQNSSGNRATYKTNIQNGQPGLLFGPAGVLYYNPVNGNSDINFLHTGPSTVIWIVQSSDDSIQSHLFDSALVTLGNRGRTTRFTVNAGNGAFYDTIFNGSGTKVAGGPTITGVAPELVTHLIVTRYENSFSGNDFEMTIGGVTQKTEETSSAPSALGASLTARFFCDTNFANNFRGYFFWGAAWNRRLTDTELNSLLGGSAYGL